MRIIGLNSGATARGAEVVLCEITGAPPHIQAQIIRAATIPYPAGFPARLRAASTVAECHIDALAQLHFELGEHLAAAAAQVVQSAGLALADVDLVASHGYNAWHNMTHQGRITGTLQLGAGAVLAEKTGITTISNLRARDVAAGGQGAPLTAYADWLLLRHAEHWRGILNLGASARLTFLPPLNDHESEPLAFEVGPGTVLMDAAVKMLSDGQREMDRYGLVARFGKEDEGWVRMRMTHPYVMRKAPKAMGRDIFGPDMAASLIKSVSRRRLSASDMMASFTGMTARTVHRSFRMAPQPISELVLLGGGRHNVALVNMLRALLDDTITFTTAESLGYDSDHMEALGYALLGHETWHNRPATLPSLTGSKQPVVVGDITPGTNYEALIRATWC